MKNLDLSKLADTANSLLSKPKLALGIVALAVLAFALHLLAQFTAQPVIAMVLLAALAVCALGFAGWLALK